MIETVSRRGLAALALGALAACGMSVPPTAGAGGGEAVFLAAPVALGEIQIEIPAELRVSDAANYYPNADVVWHGDPPGDRRAQLAAIFREAGAQAQAASAGNGRVADAAIRLVRFHSLSPRARITVGGVHNIVYDLVLRDAATGATVLSRRVDASIPAYGGLAAVRAEERGETQRVRVVGAIAASLLREVGTQAPTTVVVERPE